MIFFYSSSIITKKKKLEKKEGREVDLDFCCRENTCTWKRHRLRFSGYEQASVHRGGGITSRLPRRREANID